MTKAGMGVERVQSGERTVVLVLLIVLVISGLGLKAKAKERTRRITIRRTIGGKRP
jgi:hypothetical protein